jgi:hypothetical protein
MSFTFLAKTMGIRLASKLLQGSANVIPARKAVREKHQFVSAPLIKRPQWTRLVHAAYKIAVRPARCLDMGAR